MNKDFYAGMFFGGVLALVISALLLAFAPDYLGLSALLWIVVLDLTTHNFIERLKQ